MGWGKHRTQNIEPQAVQHRPLRHLTPKTNRLPCTFLKLRNRRKLFNIPHLMGVKFLHFVNNCKGRDKSHNSMFVQKRLGLFPHYETFGHRESFKIPVV